MERWVWVGVLLGLCGCATGLEQNRADDPPPTTDGGLDPDQGGWEVPDGQPAPPPDISPGCPNVEPGSYEGSFSGSHEGHFTFEIVARPDGLALKEQTISVRLGPLTFDAKAVGRIECGVLVDSRIDATGPLNSGLTISLAGSLVGGGKLTGTWQTTDVRLLPQGVLDAHGAWTASSGPVK